VTHDVEYRVGERQVLGVPDSDSTSSASAAALILARSITAGTESMPVTLQ
jgi:hypothetical protein